MELVKGWLEQGMRAREFFDEAGKWTADGRRSDFSLSTSGQFTPDIPISTTSLEEKEAVFEGQEKADFLAFVRKMLQWDPKERASPQELLHDRWLRDMPDVAEGTIDQSNTLQETSAEGAGENVRQETAV